MQTGSLTSDSNKLTKHNVLLKSSKVSSSLLETLPYSKSNLSYMLNKHSYLYIKPVHGSLGRGIVSVTKIDNSYILKEKNNRQPVPNFGELVKLLRKYTAKRKYLIQKGLHVLKYENCHVDVRVIFQKPSSTWMFCGIGVRIAPPSYIISNYSAGGSITSLYNYLDTCGVPNDKKKIVERDIADLCYKSAQVLSLQYQSFRKLGFDIGLDINLKPWIIEVNTSPGYKLFKILDIDIYNKIRANDQLIRSQGKIGKKPKKVSPKVNI